MSQIVVGPDEPGQAEQVVEDYVFISYAREDRRRLDTTLFAPLNARGIDYWFDEHIEFDSNWWDSVRNRLRGAHAVIVVMTSAAHRSDWVTREVQVAKERDKPIFPVLLDDPPLVDLARAQVLRVGEDDAVPADWLEEVERRVKRGRNRRRARVLGTRSAAALAVVTGLLALGQFVAPFFGRDPLPQLDGFYNLGVANFDDPSDTDLREDVATEVGRFEASLLAGVNNALELERSDSGQSQRILTISAAHIPRTVSGDGLATRRSAAAELAGKTGADLLLYGKITSDGALLSVQPELYLAASALPRAEELAGRLELEPIEKDLTRPDAALALRGEVASLGRQLAGLLLLISHYDSERWEQALEVVTDLRSDGFREEGLLAVLEGNLLGKLGRHEDAVLAYESALDSPYAERARLGLAQALYSEGVDDAGGCGAETSVDLVEESLNDYRALQDTVEDDGGNVRVKAQFGEARARYCLLIATGQGTGEPVRELLTDVVAAYEAAPTDGDLRELAAEAEGLLGILVGRPAGSSNEAEEAVSHLDRAIDLSVFTERRIVFHRFKAQLLARVGETARACTELDELERLLGVLDTNDLRRDFGCSARLNPG